MQIDKVIAVNWGQLETREYKFYQKTLLTGSTGSGKTTLADAVQTVMTATKSGLFAYNPGQEESNQHGKHGKTFRTLESYILGADESGYARPQGAHGHVAVVFQPSKDEVAAPFTAIVSATATLDARHTANGTLRAPVLDDLRLFIIEGAAASLEDFIASRSDAQLAIVPVNELFGRLRSKYRGIEEYKTDKGKYLTRLYSLFRGLPKLNKQEAEQAARTFSRFMAYKPIESVDQFVKSQILVEADQSLQIMHISEMMRNVDELRFESERLNTNIEKLEGVERQGDAYLGAWRDLYKNRLWHAMREAFEIRNRIDAHEKVAAVYEEVLHKLERNIADYDRQANELQQRRDRIQRQRSEHSAAQEKDRLEADLETAGQYLRDALIKMGAELGTLNKNLAGLKELEQRRDDLSAYPELRGVLQDVFDVLDAQDIDRIGQASAVFGQIARTQGAVEPGLAVRLLDAVSGMDSKIRLLVDRLSAGEESIATYGHQIVGRLRSELTTVKAQAEELRGKIANLKGHGRIEYPDSVAMALASIQQAYPEARAQVLCDLITVRNPEWQPVIEGYMGMRRFSILVEPEYEARATALARRGRKGSASIIQGSLAKKDADRTHLSPRSIANELEIVHPIARAYVTASFGSVNKADNIEELRHERRGVSLDGYGSGGYAMFECALGDGELTFGKNAREKRGVALEQEYRNVLARQEEINREIADLMAASQVSMKIQSVSAEDFALEIERYAQEMAGLQKAVSAIDLSELQDLEAELADLNTAQAELTTNSRTANTEIGVYRQKLQQAVEDATQTRTRLEEVNVLVTACREEVAALGLSDERVVLDDILQELEARVSGESATAQEIQEQIKAARRQLETRRARFLDAVSDYNQTARAMEQLALETDIFSRFDADDPQTQQAILAGMLQVRERLRQQRDTGLVEVLDKLKTAQRDVHSAFTSDFCQMLHGRLQEGERTIRHLNKELESHEFGNARYYFASEWVPEFKRYYDFFKAVMEIDDLGEQRDLFSSETLTDAQAEIRDELIDMLVNSNAETAQRRLAEIGDYRRYHRFEIYKDTGNGQPIPLSTYGTGSGGQLETPSYMIRAAAVTSAFRHREGNVHLRTVLIDESFAKMDERHARDVLNYLSEILGFQVIFIMPSKASGSFLDMISSQIKFAKVKSPVPVGELGHMILSQQQVFEQEALQQLWQAHREEVRERAAIGAAAANGS
jgi:DNA repair exonuclease SbcCD ATPase subunit